MRLITALSTVADGDMGLKSNTDAKIRADNIELFLGAQNISISNTTRVSVTYGGNNFCRYREVGLLDKGSGMVGSVVGPADALVTKQPNHALFLTLADCVGMVVFDPTKQVLMLSHIGRHSLEQNGAYKSIKFLVDNYGCSPSELKVHLTPAPGQENYPLYAFDNRDFKEVVLEQLQAADIISENIVNDPADTTKDMRYYSHSEFLKGNRDVDGRYAVMAMMSED